MNDDDRIDLDNVEEHVFDLFVNRSVLESDLGIVKRSDNIVVTVDDRDYEIKQSISMLNTSSSSTGAVAWKVSPLFAEWMVNGPLKGWIEPNQTTIVELGCGSAGLLASVLGPKCQRFIATDQKHILKLCRQNVQDNAPLGCTSIEIKEYDWEYAKQMVADLNISGSSGLIIACDTIYNDYLIPYFVEALKLVAEQMDHPKILIAQQLRSEEVLEQVLTQLLSSGFTMFNIPESMLDSGLQKGYVIHFLTLEGEGVHS